MSIKAYVLWILLGLIGGQMLLFSLTFYAVEYDAAVRQAEAHQTDTMQKLRSVCQESAMRTSPFAAINFANILAKDPAISHALCADFNGRILAHTDLDQIGRYLSKDSPALEAKAPGKVERAGEMTILETYSPVVVHSRRVGAVSVGFNRAVLDERVRHTLWGIAERLLLVSCLTLVVVLLAAFAVAQRLTGPITELVAGAKQIASGNLQYEVPAERGRADEMRFLIEEFNLMSRRLREIEEMKERFLASITHDLRAPLVGIQGHTELLMNQDLTEDQAKHLDTIYTSSQMLSHFISDILDLSRLEAGRMDLKPAALDLAEVVESVRDLMSVKAEEYGIRLETRLPPDLPRVHADRKFLHRVLNNLVSNALKFTPEGGSVTLSASTALELKDGNALPREVRVEVLDSGPGIPPAKLESVFEKFFQVEETRAQSRSEGTGLGLAIAREVIQAHGGRIWAENNNGGGGAVFKFTLPIAGGPPRAIAA